MTRRFQGWTIPDDEPRPLSLDDLPTFLRMLAIAIVVVVVGILAAPYLYAALLGLGEALS